MCHRPPHVPSRTRLTLLTCASVATTLTVKRSSLRHSIDCAVRRSTRASRSHQLAQLGRLSSLSLSRKRLHELQTVPERVGHIEAVIPREAEIPFDADAGVSNSGSQCPEV